jgi:dTDP-4-dehydrorhamnose reductase
MLDLGLIDDFPANELELEERLSRPPVQLIEMMSRLRGDFLFLGAGGKMGPSMARMARRATDAAGVQRRIVAVSRYQNSADRDGLEKHGIETFGVDLLKPGALEALPDAENIIYLAGMKFGSTGQEPLTWAMNSLLPGLVCRRYPRSRMVAFSTGNIYGMVPVSGSGSLETDPPNPVGEYAQSCLGRERIFQYASLSEGTRVAIIRLNYACDLRYGVMVDIASRVLAGEPVDITVNAFNIIWQADANALSLLCLELASSPPFIGNLSGLDKISVSDLAQYYGRAYNHEILLKNEDSGFALLTDARALLNLLSYKPMKNEILKRWVAEWIFRGGQTLRKPTGFEKLDGRF